MPLANGRSVDGDSPLRAGGILGQGGTSIPDIQDTLNAVDAKKLRRVGPYAAASTHTAPVSTPPH